jgi:exosortase J
MPTSAPGATPLEATPEISFPAAVRPHSRFFIPQAAALATTLSVIGVFSVFSTAMFLYALWTTDPLKSIGGLIPIVSLVLILRAWHSLGWEMRGTWWGLAIVAVIIATVHLRDHAIIELILTPSWAIFVPPHSLVAFGYTAGAVLLFGGVRLFRAALFPIVLTWFVNPVPNAFNLLIDLPLQHASAKIARAFAHMLGQPLTSDQLRLMFTPDFGMFIAPGCNGIRGAITMGFIALIAGYLYRFRLKFHILFVVAAIMLGYIFNLIRLCVLVLYYIVALKIPWLQSRAEMGDYIIGACLFLFATFLLFTVILRLSPTGTLRPPPLPTAKTTEADTPRSFIPRLAMFALVIAIGSISYARALIANHNAPQTITDPKALGHFPAQVGHYKLDHAWNEYLVTGPLIFYWADYAPDNGGAHVAVGISPVLGAHDTLLCHAARGEDWLWHDTLALNTAGEPTSFSASFFNDGATQYLEATTLCTGASCGQYSSSRQHFGFVYSRPDTRTLLTQSPTRPIPVLLKTETTDTAMAA